MNDRYLLVDLSNFIFRFAKKKGSADKIAEEVLNNISSFRDSLACSKVIIFLDYKGSKYRKELYPEYKGNRKKEGKFYEDLKEFFKKLPTITKILNLHFPVISYEGIEADDLIYFVAKYLEGRCVILSTDADLLQIDVPQFSYTKKKFITLEDQGAANKDQFITAKALAGDTSDNIKGLERVGLKTALKYLTKYDADYFEELQERIPKNTKSKIEQRILNGRDVYERNIKLVDLELVNDDILSDDIKKEVVEIIEEFDDV
jgi:DNA polymerase-1